MLPITDKMLSSISMSIANYHISTLKDDPHLLADTIHLIEKSFAYNSQFSFSEDFYPLINKSNHHHCFILKDADQVIAHVGLKIKTLSLSPDFQVGLLGGIATDENYRGLGCLKKLMEYIRKQTQKDLVFYLLWSDQHELYKKMGFYLCGELYSKSQIPNSKSNDAIINLKMNELTDRQKQAIIDLYNKNTQLKNCLHFTRTQQDWQDIFGISSVNVLLETKENQIENYAFKGKGQDLTNVIHELSNYNESFLRKLNSLGHLWMPQDNLDCEQLYAFLLAPASLSLFNQLIMELSQKQIVITDLKEDHIKISFGSQFYEMSLENFLQGYFGPTRIQEFKDFYKPFFISGVESI